jgi:hypothetical protein
MQNPPFLTDFPEFSIEFSASKPDFRPFFFRPPKQPFSAENAPFFAHADCYFRAPTAVFGAFFRPPRRFFGAFLGDYSVFGGSQNFLQVIGRFF